MKSGLQEKYLQIMKKTKEKEFDAVKMMRDIREKLSLKYRHNTKLLKKDTTEAIKEFKHRVRIRQPA